MSSWFVEVFAVPLFVTSVTAALGFIGFQYVSRYFDPTLKAKTEALYAFSDLLADIRSAVEFGASMDETIELAKRMVASTTGATYNHFGPRTYLEAEKLEEALLELVRRNTALSQINDKEELVRQIKLVSSEVSIQLSRFTRPGYSATRDAIRVTKMALGDRDTKITEFAEKVIDGSDEQVPSSKEGKK